MADPRFYDNRGPFALADLCARAGCTPPATADGRALVFDVAGLKEAGPQHVSFFESRRARAAFETTRAGWCIVRPGQRSSASRRPAPVLLEAEAVSRAFGDIARRFYPEHELGIAVQETPVHPTAALGEGVVLAPGVVIGPGAQVGDRTRVGANSVIGRGVTIGGDCEIGAHAFVGFALIGDKVLLQPGVVIGASGFGFVSGPDGHAKIPQLGRVIIQDRVEVGANSTIDRGALSDTVIGEGTKIDNLVQIGHNTITGRHCVIAGQVGISGSVVLGDFVVIGGMAGIADHVRIGSGARLAGLTGVASDLEAGREYGGIPARLARDWLKETVALARLAKRGKRMTDE